MTAPDPPLVALIPDMLLQALGQDDLVRLIGRQREEIARVTTELATMGYLQDVALAARAMLDLNPKMGLGSSRPIGWLTLMRALDQLEMGGVTLPETGVTE